MIRVGDYIIVNDFGYRCLCKLVSVGREENNIRSVSVKLLEPYLINEIFRITIDTRTVVVLDENQVKVAKLLYE